jgi:hypothetical protein
MNMPALASLSRTEKLQMMEALWDDLTRDTTFPVPEWHADALKATEQAVAAGEAGFVDWELAKKALREGRQ